MKSGVLTKLITAFSRAQKEKVYVQNVMENESDLIWEYVNNKKGSIYVCGGTQMGKDVQQALEGIIAKKSK